METKGYTKDGTVDLHGRPVLAAKTGRWRACAYLVAYEAFERMAFYGVAANLVVYLTTQLHEDTVSSVRSVNNWTGSVWITPILGAFIADSYFGRFWTFTVSSLVYVLGMVMLTMAVSLKSLRPTCAAREAACGKATSSQLAFFFSALYIIAVGAGGTKPNISTFGADQFDDYDGEEKRRKASFFNWWMFSSFLGGLMATLGLVYVQENLGWGVGYAIPTTGLVVSLLIFYVGTPNYRHKVRQKESPAREVARVWAAAFANRRLRLPEDPEELHEMEQMHYVVTGKRRLRHTSSFRFLDKAAVKGGRSPNPPTATQVEESKLVLGMSIIWLTSLVPCTIFAQVNTLFLKQGTTLNRSIAGGSFRIPAASVGSFVTISMLIAIPLYDRCFVPLARRRTGRPRGITLLQRLGIGFATHILVTAAAYSVELRRMRVIRSHHVTSPDAVVPMSILWLVPQYVLLGLGDVFTTIGLLEFFYDQSPEGMQSLGTTFFTSGIGVGNFLNSVLVTAVDGLTRGGGGKGWIGKNVNDSRLDYYYALLMGITAVNLGAFLWAATGYNYKEEAAEATPEAAKIEIVGTEC